MRFFSLKWKIAIAMAGLSVLVVLLYILLAKNTFEQDKISYVYDTQQTQADLLSNTISQKIEKVLLQSQLLVGQYLKDGITPQLDSYVGLDPKFEILVFDPADMRVLFHLGRQTRTLQPPSSWPRFTPNQAVFIQVESLQSWRLLSQVKNQSGSKSLYVMAALPLGTDFSSLRESQKIVLATETDLLPVRFEAGPFEQLQKPLLEALKHQNFSSTFELNVGDEENLVSQGFLTLKPYRILIFSETKEALQALQLLFKRSLFFIVFSISFIFALSFLLSRQLTGTLTSLTEATEKIGQGDFEPTPPVKSSDEIGRLSSAFEVMKHKIRDLLSKTKETARMEQELKTAKLVQESLLPKKSQFQVGSLSLSGYFETSSECGGDWWYYFTQGDDLYVAIADATGHGTPAALITSAARSCFSFFEKNPPSLAQMMESWSDAVASCSNQRVFMTSMIFKFNCKTGHFAYANASHEAPFQFKNEKNLFYAEPLDMIPNKTLGEENRVEWKILEGQLAPSEKLMIFTDGLFAVVDEAGNMLSEKRALKQIQKMADTSQNITEFGDKTMALFSDHRKGTALPDDITVVFVERLAH